jgi:hypothetical protein
MDDPRSFSPAVSLPTATGFPAGRIAVLIRKYLIEKYLLSKRAIGVQPEIDFFGYFPCRQGNPAWSRGGAAGPVILP